MKLNLHKRNAPPSAVARRRRNAPSPGIALIITLLMLAAITFLAIAFLAMTRRDRAAATAGVDLNVSKEMSDAAFSRAQAEIIARMMAQNDLLSYDYMASHNFINPNGFTNDKIPSINNVNYDFIAGTTIPMTPTSQNGAPWAQNIANLYYDPRPPVFVTTNGPNGTGASDLTLPFVNGTTFPFQIVRRPPPGSRVGRRGRERRPGLPRTVRVSRRVPRDGAGARRCLPAARVRR